MMHTVKRFAAVLLVALAAIFWVTKGVGKTPATQEISVSDTTVQVVQSPTPEPIGAPRTIRIPRLDISASIDDVGMDANGRMGVPIDPHVGWWKLGVKPGEKGSAVLAGHFDTADGKPGIFHSISQLAEGDAIDITDDLGSTRTFTVYKAEMHTDADFPINEVFLTNSGELLNLITCAGIFDKDAKNYDKRFVVYSRLNSD